MLVAIWLQPYLLFGGAFDFKLETGICLDIIAQRPMTQEVATYIVCTQHIPVTESMCQLVPTHPHEGTQNYNHFPRCLSGSPKTAGCTSSQSFEVSQVFNVILMFGPHMVCTCVHENDLIFYLFVLAGAKEEVLQHDCWYFSGFAIRNKTG